MTENPMAARPLRSEHVQISRDVPAAEWDAFVEQHPDATVYHLSSWEGVLLRVFGKRMIRLGAVADGRLVGILPIVPFSSLLFGRFVTSMPFMNYGGIATSHPGAAQALAEAAIAEARTARAAYLELRHTRRSFDDWPAQTRKVSMVLPLQATAEAQFAAIDRKLRNQVRKAEKSGLTVRTGGVELAGAFHRVMAENMRDLGSPVHGQRFFEEILTALGSRSRVFTVWLGDVPIAASLVLWHRDRLEVPWASSIRRYNPLCPNILMYWEMLKFGVERGCHGFDFGRSTPDEGTYLFKEQWGAQPVPLFWEYWLADGARVPDRSPKNPKFSLALEVWKRLPVSVTQALGPWIVRGIP
jgi:FemAB-related protein (PEP-CTERM system-associated)